MKIQCVLLRDGGTITEIGGISYHFEPLADGAHVAEVTVEDHIDRFLSIAEGYKLYRGDETPKGTPSAVTLPVVSDPTDLRRSDASSVQTLYGSAVHEASYDIGGKTYLLGDVVAKAHAASGLSPEEWNALDDDERHAKIDIALDDLADQVEGAGVPSDERAALVVQYEAKFGKKPHYRASVEKIKAELEA